MILNNTHEDNEQLRQISGNTEMEEIVTYTTYLAREHHLQISEELMQ